MGAYLIDNKPARDQFAARTRWSKSRITGLTVLHTAEGVMDTIGPDTGAEATAEFIRRRADPGSYHDLVDSDSWMRLVPLELGAYQDGTGSNGFATSISFACKTVDWARMTVEKRRGFLYQGALAFADQQRWRAAHGHPLTELRLITKAQSDAGESGFIYHGQRDPDRRTDPGTTPAAPFPFDEFINLCRAAVAGDLEDDMPLNDDDVKKIRDAVWRAPMKSTVDQKDYMAYEMFRGTDGNAHAAARAAAGLQAAVGSLTKTVATLAAGQDGTVDVDALVARLDATVRDAMADVVKVEVSVGDDRTTA